MISDGKISRLRQVALLIIDIPCQNTRIAKMNNLELSTIKDDTKCLK